MTAPDWEIAPVAANQMAGAYALHAASFSQDAGDFLSEKGFRDLAAGRGTVLLAAGVKGDETRFCGYVLFRRLGDEAELLSVAVAPDCRGKGLGLKLLSAMVKDLNKAGVKTVFLEVSTENPQALSLYEAFGFTRIGTRKGYYRSKSGEENDAQVMKFDIC